MQGGRGVTLPRARRLVRSHTHVQRSKGLRQDLPVHEEGHRKMSAGTLFTDAVLLVGRQTDW
jgi:hypothetical protein